MSESIYHGKSSAFRHLPFLTYAPLDNFSSQTEKNCAFEKKETTYCQPLGVDKVITKRVSYRCCGLGQKTDIHEMDGEFGKETYALFRKHVTKISANKMLRGNNSE